MKAIYPPRIRKSIFTAIFVSASLAQAYLGDIKPVPKQPAHAETLPALPAASPNADQRDAAQKASAGHIQTEWHSQLGTPQSIRGPGLGKRAAFSGGKGLAPAARSEPERNAIAVMDNLARLYRVHDAEQEFAAKKAEGDSLGFTHVRLKQTHQGLQVVGGELIVHFNKEGDAYQVNGEYVPDIQIETTPALSAAQAEAIARKDLLALSKTAGALENPPTLAIFALNAAPQLAYELVVVTDDSSADPGRWRYWIDAQQGRVLLRYNDIKKIAAPTSNGANAPITGNILTGENGSVTTVTGWYENTGYFYLYSTNRHWEIFNAATTNNWSDTNTYAFRATSNWGTSDRVEMSAARNYDIVQQYYKTVHNRNSFNNAGILAVANVHYQVNYVNAFWNSTAFYFGDGNGTTANSLAVLDVCGHEYTHAVTEYTAGLIYSSESGALNESFSDVMGTCVEFFAQPDGRSSYPAKSAGMADWLCGEDCWLSSAALRDLRNPANTATVGAGNQQPTRYRGTYWDPLEEVHQNSGVQNQFFYFLCEGGSGNNDGIIYSLTGIGVTNAERVAYRALTVYCTPNTGYQAVRTAWISAAQDLNPAWVPNVKAAWTAVGVSSLRLTPAQSVAFRGPVGGAFSPASQNITLQNTDGTSSLNWSVTSSLNWLTFSATNGSIAPGGSNTLTLSVNASANALAAGRYTNILTFSNSLETIVQTFQVRLSIGLPDYFTELFDQADNDLDFQTWTFTPDGSTNFYSACREAATVFPTDPTGGAILALTDDSFAQITLSGTNKASIYNTKTNILYVGSNGYLTMSNSDSSIGPSLSQHFFLPRVSGLYADLYPSNNVSWKELSNRLAVTYLNVRKYGFTDTNSFQIELFFDGRIRLTCLRIDAVGGLAGLSAGGGTPTTFEESDLSSYGGCTTPLLVSLPASATEGNGVLAGAGQVSVPAALATNLAVTLTSTATSEVIVANTVILAGQTNAAFDLNIQDDAVLDGSQPVQITAAASGYAAGSATFFVHDNETATLAVTLPGSTVEGSAPLPCTVMVSATPARDVIVSLSSSDTTEIQVPASVIIPTGQTSAVFNASVVDDSQIDGTQTATVTAHVQNWTDGSDTISISDNEPTNLTVYLPASAYESEGTLNNAGSVCISGTLPFDLVVSLNSSDTTELTVPATATILAGQVCAPFNLIMVDDGAIDGPQPVTVTASTAGFMSGGINMTVLDDETPPVPSNPSPAHLATDVIKTADLSWQSGALAGMVITNYVYFGTNPSPGAGELLGSTTNTSWVLPNLTPFTTYYWKVVAHRVGTTAGPVWRFTTRGVDHFDWSAISSPQLAGSNFPVTITAKDDFGAVVSNFTGTAALSASSGQAEILRLDFESGLQGFVINNRTNGLWHVSTGRANNAGHSPTHSLYYGQGEGINGGGNYNTTNNSGTPVANSGVVTSPAILLPAGVPAITLSYGYLMNVESGTNWDRALIEISTNNGVTYLPVAVKGAFGLTNATGGLWVSNSVALTQFAGSTIRLRFNFDTIDGLVNSTEGWYLDDIVILSGAGGVGNLAIAPTNTGAFANGAWTGGIAVLQAATNVFLLAREANGHSGLTTNFDVSVANDLSLTMTDTPDPVVINTPLTNVITVLNSGPDAATGVVVTNFLSFSATYASATSSQGSCAFLGDRVECSLGTILGGASATITVVTLPTVAGLLSSTATVGRSGADGNPANNSTSTTTLVAVPSLTISDASMVEGNAGTATMTFQVALIPASQNTVTVSYATADGTASAGSDYSATNGTLTFVPGQTNATILVTVFGDFATEASETFNVTLSNPTNAVLVDGLGVGTIVDDDGVNVSLPYNLYDSYPYLWDIYGNGNINNGTSDAYDGGLVSLNFPTYSTAQLVGGREVVIGPASLSGLQVSRRIYVPTNHSYCRFLEVLVNPGASPINHTVRIDSNLGSDSSTVLVNTSSGDTVFGTNDNWIVTDDTDAAGDPTLLHVIANDAGSIRPTVVSLSSDQMSYLFPVTVPPGDTRIVMHFAAQNPNRATAMAKAPDLTALLQDALTQISPSDVSHIVNFAPATNQPPVPQLRFLPPQMSGGNLLLALGTADASPLSPARTNHIFLYASTNLSLNISNWTLVNSPMTLTNGWLRIDGLNATNDGRYFRAMETP